MKRFLSLFFLLFLGFSLVAAHQLFAAVDNSGGGNTHPAPSAYRSIDDFLGDQPTVELTVGGKSLADRGPVTQSDDPSSPTKIHVRVSGIPKESLSLLSKNKAVLQLKLLDTMSKNADGSVLVAASKIFTLTSSLPGCSASNTLSSTDDNKDPNNVWLSGACVTNHPEYTDQVVWEGDIDTSKLLNHNTHISRTFKLQVSYAQAKEATQQETTYNNYGNTQNQTTVTDSLKYGGTSSVNFTVKPNKSNQVKSDMAPFKIIGTDPKNNAIPGRDIIIHLDNAITTPHKDDKGKSDPPPIEYHYGVDGEPFTLGDCSTTKCDLVYTIPDDLADKNAPDTINIIVIGPDKDSNYTQLDQGAENIHETNDVEDPITLDKAWAKIIAKDQKDQGADAEQRCVYQNIPKACPFVKNPKKNGSEYIVDPKVQDTSANNVLACHSASDNQAFICDNSQEVACDTNPYRSGKVTQDEIRCVSAAAYPTLDPCESKTIDNGDIHCTMVQSFISIPTDPDKLVSWIVGLLLSVAGAVALVIIMLQGYVIMMSQGNPDAIKEAREKLTSAIVGLVFIIFSLTLFEIITHDLLHIPGFS